MDKQFDTSKYVKLSWDQQEEIRTGKFHVRKENETACPVEEVVEALQELLRVKWIKDNHGKCEDYLRRQPLAWEAAEKALAALPEHWRGQ